jgi:hypothetical protein
VKAVAPSGKGGISERRITELEINSMNKSIKDLYRGINEFKKGYQPRTNLVKDENGDLLADTTRKKNLSATDCTWWL